MPPGREGMQPLLDPGAQCRPSSRLRPGGAQHLFPAPSPRSLLTSHLNQVTPLQSSVSQPLRSAWNPAPQAVPGQPGGGGGALVGLTIQLGSRLHLERHQSRGSPGSPALTTLAHGSPGLHSFSPSLPPSFPLPCAQHGP